MQKQPSEASPSVTWRSLAIGLVLIPLNCYWIVESELVAFSGHPTCVSLIFTVVFSVFVLSVLNLLLRRFLPKSTLSQGELIVIYVMLSVVSATAGHNFMEILVPILGHAFWFATPENEWKDLFWRDIPSWLSVSDRDILKGYYEGDSTLYTVRHISGWLKPVLSWYGFISALVLVMLCINMVFRKQWTEKEKLAYPIIQLPYEMTGEGFLKNRIMWIGFAIAASIGVTNGLNFLFPTIPRILAESYSISFADKPFSAMGRIILGTYPFVIGIGFLVPLDLLLSCWFFYLFWLAQLLFGSIMGWRTHSGHGGLAYPYVNYQGYGAYIGIFLIVLWMGRKYLANVLGKILDKGELDDSNEPVSYRTTLLALVGGLTFLTLFCLRAGMSLWVILAFFLLYFALSTAISRMRAELGSPVHDLPYTGPAEILIASAGTRRFGPNNLTMFSFFWFFTRAFGGHPMPHQLEGFKLAERANINSRRFLFAILLALGVGILVQFWVLLSVPYRLGAETRFFSPSVEYFGREPWERLQRRLQNPAQPNYPAMASAIVGVLFTFFLMVMRMRFFWWPLHPAAYAATFGGFAAPRFAFCFFVAWVAKRSLLEYRGPDTYRKAIPLFLGLILGEIVIGSLWTVMGMVFNMHTYGFSW